MDFGPLFLSFEVALAATAVSAVVGVGVAALLANFRFWGRDVIDVLFTAPIVMPPTVLGYYVIVLLGRESVIGRGFEALTGTTIVFTETGAILAAVIGGLPLVVKGVRAALEDTDPSLVLAARTLGATPVFAFLTVQLPLARRGIIASLMLSFARSLGDFGITLMVGGNIKGKTKTAAIAIYDYVQAHEDREATIMAILLTSLGLALMYAAAKLTTRQPGA